MATSQILEEILLELQRKDVTIPENIISNLRAARSLIKVLDLSKSDLGETTQKIDEYLSTVEAFLITEAEKTFPEEKIDALLRKLEVASCNVCVTTVEPPKENRFVTGVPRDQKWVRVEAMDELPLEKLEDIAIQNKLQFREENSKQLVVYGSKEDLKQFIKIMTQKAGQK